MRLAVLVTAVGVMVACSGAPQPQPQPQPQPAQLGDPWAADVRGKCAQRLWGGWDGTDECAAIKDRRIAGEDRACATDADCVRLSGSNCDENVVSTAAAESYRDWPAPCNDPRAGDCSPSRAACVSGCCASVDD